MSKRFVNVITGEVRWFSSDYGVRPGHGMEASIPGWFPVVDTDDWKPHLLVASVWIVTEDIGMLKKGDCFLVQQQRAQDHPHRDNDKRFVWDAKLIVEDGVGQHIVLSQGLFRRSNVACISPPLGKPVHTERITLHAIVEQVLKYRGLRRDVGHRQERAVTMPAYEYVAATAASEGPLSPPEGGGWFLHNAHMAALHNPQSEPIIFVVVIWARRLVAERAAVDKKQLMRAYSLVTTLRQDRSSRRVDTDGDIFYTKNDDARALETLGELTDLLRELQRDMEDVP